MVHYRTHTSPPLVLIQSQIILVRLPPKFLLLFLGLSTCLFPSGLSTLYKPLLSPIRATCSAQLILDLITRITPGEEGRP